VLSWSDPKFFSPSENGGSSTLSFFLCFYFFASNLKPPTPKAYRLKPPTPKANVCVRPCVSVAKFNNAKLELNYQEQISLPCLPNEIFVAFISSGLNLFVSFV
jgi:hypothetical protein